MRDDPNYHERTVAALEVALKYICVTDAGHKAWVIDQMVRALTGDDYDQIVWEACNDQSEGITYQWDEGARPDNAGRPWR